MPLSLPVRKYEKWTDSAARGWQTRGVRGYGQYCPVAKAAEVLGERWTLLIVRDLITGAHRFTDLQRGLPGVSRTLLSESRWGAAGVRVVGRRAGASGREEYWLTPLGGESRCFVVRAVERGGRAIGAEPKRDQLDPV